jgi:uroporphyrin-3 C-methyltransferase
MHGMDWVNTDISEIDNEINESPPQKEKSSRSGGGLAFLALLVSFAALGGTAWMWWQGQASLSDSEDKVFAEIARLSNADEELSLKLNQLRDQVSALPSSDNTATVSALDGRLKAGMAEIDRLAQSVSEQLALTRSVQTATESMQGRLLAAEAAVAGVASQELDAGGDLDLAEVDYLLRLANERLKLFDDPSAADEALELADSHLEALNNPMYLGVRQEIASARRELADMVVPDYFKISNEIDSVQSSLGSVPFRDETQVPEEQPADRDEPGWWEKLKGVFSGLVTVRRSTEQENERISLQDRDFVRQRLWLQLETARLSLMRRDQQAFRQALQRVRTTLQTWFDDNSADYQSLQERLEALQGLEIEVAVPDINQPWATLRLLRQGRARPAPAVSSSSSVESIAEPVEPEPPAPEAPEGSGAIEQPDSTNGEDPR